VGSPGAYAQIEKLPFNVEVTGAARLYRAAAGLANGGMEDSTRRPARADF